MDIIMGKEEIMHGESGLEYMCPHCGATNTVQVGVLQDMYKEQFHSCSSCAKHLSLTPADGVGGKINLVVDSLDPDFRAR